MAVTYTEIYLIFEGEQTVESVNRQFDNLVDDGKWKIDYCKFNQEFSERTEILQSRLEPGIPVIQFKIPMYCIMEEE